MYSTAVAAFQVPGVGPASCGSRHMLVAVQCSFQSTEVFTVASLIYLAVVVSLRSTAGVVSVSIHSGTKLVSVVHM